MVEPSQPTFTCLVCLKQLELFLKLTVHSLINVTEQDRGLEALSEVISRQKNLAQVIGNEVDFQNELIDDITDHVDVSVPLITALSRSNARIYNNWAVFVFFFF